MGCGGPNTVVVDECVIPGQGSGNAGAGGRLSCQPSLDATARDLASRAKRSRRPASCSRAARMAAVPADFACRVNTTTREFAFTDLASCCKNSDEALSAFDWSSVPRIPIGSMYSPFELSSAATRLNAQTHAMVDKMIKRAGFERNMNTESLLVTARMGLTRKSIRVVSTVAVNIHTREFNLSR